MRNRFKKAFDRVSLDSAEKERMIENVVNNQSVVTDRKSFWAGRAGGIATVCAALAVFLLVNAVIFNGIRRGMGASAIDITGNKNTENESAVSENTEGENTKSEDTGNENTKSENTGDENTKNEDTENTVEQNAETNEPEETGGDGGEKPEETGEDAVSKEPVQTADEELQRELENILATIEHVAAMDISKETQVRLFELLTDYLPLKNAAFTSGTEVHRGIEHKGIDMTTDDTEPVIYAVMDGTVLECGWGGSKGICLVIDNGNGVITEYHHLRECLVSAGDVLSAGTPAAVMGNTGISTGIHLHWEMRADGEFVNPLCYVAEHLDLFYRH